MGICFDSTAFVPGADATAFSEAKPDTSAWTALPSDVCPSSAASADACSVGRRGVDAEFCVCVGAAGCCWVAWPCVIASAGCAGVGVVMITELGVAVGVLVDIVLGVSVAWGDRVGLDGTSVGVGHGVLVNAGGTGVWVAVAAGIVVPVGVALGTGVTVCVGVGPPATPISNRQSWTVASIARPL